MKSKAYNEAIPLLSVKNLSVQLDGQPIIQDINFALDKGEDLAIIGPNGAGKTMFLRALLGAVKFSGEVNWTQGVHLGYVPQRIDADRHLPVTAYNLLEAKLHVQNLPREEMEWAIKAAGLTEKILRTPVGHLSGGEFQRALIGFALLGKPNVLLLDEPTASIDMPGETQIYELLHELQDELGLTTILVSHDLSFVYRYATKVLCLNKTETCFGTPEESLTPAMLEKLYGGPHKYFHHIHNN
jgi:zinc transport system ATP-binding protein